MSFIRPTLAALVFLSLLALPARAQGVRLRFHDGLVTLTAQNAPLRTILTEWARLGGTTIVNGERVVGPPLTLELNAVPEAQALAVLLRSVSGYMAATRAARTAGSSIYDRLLILPTSTAPRNNPAPAPGVFQPRPGVARPPQVQIPPDADPGPEEPSAEDEQADDDVQIVNPPVRPGNRPPIFPVPVPNVQPDPDDQPAEEDPAAGVPGNPFGIPAGSTSRPGVVTPVPQGPQPQRTQPDPEP
jgi:hypothetical protein